MVNEPTPAPPDGPFDGPLDEEPPMMRPPKDVRKHAFQLIRTVTGRLGWKYKLWVPATILLSSVSLLPQWFLQFFTEGSQDISEIDASQFLYLLMIFGGAIAGCLWITIFVSGILREWMRLTVSIALRRDAVGALHRMRINELDVGHRGEWMTRMTSDLHSCEEFLTESLTEQIRLITMLVGTLALFAWYSGTIAFTLIPVAVVLVWFNIIVQKKMAPTLTEARVMEGDVFQSMIESFEGLRTIRSYGAEKFTLERINRQLQNLYVASMRIIRSMAGLLGLNEFTTQLVVVAVLTFAAFRISGAELTAANALVYPFYINMFLGSVKGLANATYDWNRFFVEGGRLADLLYDETKQVGERVYGDLEQQIGRVRKLSVEGLSISYGHAPPVVDNFNFSLESGEIVAIMGPSGCGKSTFLESFAGLRPANRGDFHLELEGGETRTYMQAPVFLSAFVEQQPYLFVGTVKENILMVGADVPDKEVWGALEEVGLADIIHQRGGLEEVLTDRGRNLSVGQQYRLALCRALVCGRPFLLLDEPFAALDVESVERVVEALHEERDRGAGVILITHLLPPSLQTTRVVEMEVSPAYYYGGPPPGAPGERKF